MLRENLGSSTGFMYIYMVPKEWFLSLVYLNIVLRMDTTFQALNRAHQVGTMFQQDLQIQIQKENILYIL